MLMRGLNRWLKVGIVPGFSPPVETPRPAWTATGIRFYSAGIVTIREQTLVAVKPDGVQRRLVGEIIQRFEKRGFQLMGLKLVQVWEGCDVVRISRMMVGDTDPALAQPGTVRGDLCVHISRNAIHASDSVEVAKKEISLWFHSTELTEWESCTLKNIYNV
ncbi:nucleoside diphosphate kinase, mitochondrial isoform X2 [Stegostoma tigrinum]|uniref:nucleoside diphosphate kinase, mitochondrial isoform X2 n=1 Tax=Stegostoma tigrinum TaxID=3053191 RepID=UPI00202AE37C|nr:nucleoside diphosphate kinase, mitochondrial isoform X2 [Stegostoma tigrinum]